MLGSNFRHVVRTLAVCILLASSCGCRKKADPPKVRINGTTWLAELAMTDAKRLRGLSGRTHLGENAGMLFIFPDAQKRSFCMRDCEIPLDIAFIGPDLRVRNTATMTVEPDRAGLRQYHSAGPAQYVLEVPAGALGKANVQVGDLVELLGDIPDATKAEHGR